MFELTQFDPFVVGPCPEDGSFDIAIRVSREQLSRLAEGHNGDGAIFLLLNPPAQYRPSCTLLVTLIDGSRFSSSRRLAKYLDDYSRYVESRDQFAVMLVLGYRKRRELYDASHLTFRVTDGFCPEPWPLLNQFIILYAEDDKTAQRTLQELV